MFLFSLTWSVGACTDAAGRVVFDDALRALVHGETPPASESEGGGKRVTLRCDLPPPLLRRDRASADAAADDDAAAAATGSTVFDYVLKRASPRDATKFAWIPWTSTIKPADEIIPPGSSFGSILVPTADGARCAYLLDVATRRAKARSISHWSPYDRVGVVNAVP